MKSRFLYLAGLVIFISPILSLAQDSKSNCFPKSVDLSKPDVKQILLGASNFIPIGRTMITWVTQQDGTRKKVTKQRYKAIDSKGNPLTVELACVAACFNCSVDGCFPMGPGCTSCTCEGRDCPALCACEFQASIIR
jgi:hypothetical protein